MTNLKHTVVATVAVVMISSLVAAQASDFSADKKNIPTQTTQVTQKADDNEVLEISDIEAAAASAEAEIADAADASQALPEQSENVGYVLVSEGSLNVRAAANIDSEVTDKLNCADKVTILSDEGDWYKVSYGEEKEGYVSKASITMSADEAKAKALETTMYETGKAVVSEGALNIRCGAGTNFAVINQADNGDTLVVVAREGDWLKVLFGRNYESGYVIADSVSIDGMISRDEIAQKKSERVAANAQSKGKISISSGAVNVRATASEEAEVITQLSNKTNVLIMSSSNGWTKIAYGDSNTIGYVKSSYVIDSNAVRSASLSSRSSSTATRSTSSSSETKKAVDSAPATGSTKGQALVNEAAKYIGTKYVYGGSSPSGFDCSGLVQYVCRKQGISVGRSSRDQFRNGVAVSKSELKPGDLVFFGNGSRVSHVGIYAGNGQMIHSPQTGKTVCYTSINSTSRQRSYMGARRVA